MEDLSQLGVERVPVSCGTVMNFGGSLGLVVLSIDLWEMLGVFGYTTAVATY